MQHADENGVLRHLERARLVAYALGRLPATDSAGVESHLAVCEACWHTVEEALPADPLVRVIRSLPPEKRRFAGTPLMLPSVTEQGVQPPAELTSHSRYEVIAFLGAGGMGQVWKARHLLMDRPVAIKVINPTLMQNHATVSRFRREVKAAARLDHANIVRSHDAEQVGRLHFLVMEFVEGVDLARLVRERGPLPVAEACDYARQVALGLQHAAGHGLVHRDIKPQNLMRTPEGQIKILDFGLASFLAGDEEGDVREGLNAVLSTSPDGSVTRLGEGCGTPDYIAPEQIRDARRVDGRADIYSLGCTLYHLLAGHPPFPGGTGFSKVAGHLERTPRPLSDVRRDLPADFLGVLNRMLAKEPGMRFPTPREVADALAPFTSPCGDQPPERRGRGMNRRRWLVGVAATGLGPAGGVAVWRGRKVPSAKEVRRFEGHTAAIQSVALSPDGRFALSGGEDGTMRLWSLEGGEEVRRFVGHGDWIGWVAFLPDGRRAMSASYDRTLRLWDLDTGEVIRRYVGAGDVVICLAISRMGGKCCPAGRTSSSGTSTAVPWCVGWKG